MIDSTPSISDVRPGMTLERALSIHPDALVIEADEPHYRGVFTRILISLQQISDRVEDAELGTAYVRLDGLEHLHGGEARLVNALLNAVPRDLAPRVGVAEAKFPAFVAAYGESNRRGPPGPLPMQPRSLHLTPSTCSPCPPT